MLMLITYQRTVQTHSFSSCQVHPKAFLWDQEESQVKGTLVVFWPWWPLRTCRLSRKPRNKPPRLLLWDPRVGRAGSRLVQYFNFCYMFCMTDLLPWTRDAFSLKGETQKGGILQPASVNTMIGMNQREFLLLSYRAGVGPLWGAAGGGRVQRAQLPWS